MPTDCDEVVGEPSPVDASLRAGGAFVASAVHPESVFEARDARFATGPPSAGTDLVRVRDVGLRGATDEAVLVRAASEGRVVLTHDVATLIARAYERVRARQPMPGVIAVSQALPVGQVIEDLLLVV